MKLHASRFLILLLALLLTVLSALPVLAADINLGVTVTNGTDTITVAVDNSDDANSILAATPAKLEIPCSFSAAYVVFDGKVLEGSVLDTVNEIITFPVEKGGTYTIHSGSPCTIAFDSKGGSAVASQTIPANGKITEPEDPAKEGYLFNGWFHGDPETEWNFTTGIVTDNLTLYAKWTQGILVTFNTDNGSAVASQTLASGDRIVQPATPTKSGYAFAGWYKESTLSTPWDFEEDTVSENVTLYAKWNDTKTGSAVTSGAGSWNPQVDAGTLDAAANAQAGNSVDLRLTITSLTDTSVPDADAAAIEDLALGRALKYLDMTLECSINNGTFTDIGNDNDELLKITLDFDPAGKNNIAVFRYHGDEADVLPYGTATGSGERFMVDTTNKKLTIYASRFSTYAIGYTTGSAALVDYTFSKGHNSSWAKDSTRNLVFVCNGPYAQLEKMTVNGQDISLTYAESCDTGTQITLKPAFLKNLVRGKYYLELHFENGGYAIAAFTVTRSTGIANTRDLFNMALWGSLLGISAVGVITLVILKKRKK